MSKSAENAQPIPADSLDDAKCTTGEFSAANRRCGVVTEAVIDVVQMSATETEQNENKMDCMLAPNRRDLTNTFQKGMIQVQQEHATKEAMHMMSSALEFAMKRAQCEPILVASSDADTTSHIDATECAVSALLCQRIASMGSTACAQPVT